MPSLMSSGGFGGSVAAVFRALVGGVQVEIPAVTLVNSDGGEGGQAVSAVATSAGGALSYSKMSLATANADVIKASAGRLYGYQFFNTTASAKYVRLYNKATAPNPAADAALIVLRVMVPPNGVAALHLGPGFAGFINGIGIVATGAPGDTDATATAANDLLLNAFYA